MLYILTKFPHILCHVILMKFLRDIVTLTQLNGQVHVGENNSLKIDHIADNLQRLSAPLIELPVPLYSYKPGIPRTLSLNVITCKNTSQNSGKCLTYCYQSIKEDTISNSQIEAMCRSRSDGEVCRALCPPETHHLPAPLVFTIPEAL